MTIEEKKEALIESGVKVRSNASDETVEELYAEFQAEDTKPIGEPEPEPEEVAVSEDPPEEVETVADSEPEEESTGIYTLADFRKFMEQNGTKELGSKTPVVFKWALENLSNEDFNSIYAGRTVNGEKIKAK